MAKLRGDDTVRDVPAMAIVTPSFNQAAFLDDAIQSVLDQCDPNLHYAVIDGGSTDGSDRIISKYENHLEFWCSEPDGGQAAAIIKGFKHVAGYYKGWLNSDDVYVDGAFKKVRQVFASDPELGLVYGNRVLIGSSGEVLGWTILPPFDPSEAGYSIASECAFWTADAELKVGPIDHTLQFAIDLDFFGRLYMGSESRKIEDFLGKFRCHDDSKSATIGDVGLREAEEMWLDLFGVGEGNWSVRPQMSRRQLYAAGFRHPRLLMLPYLLNRLRRV